MIDALRWRSGRGLDQPPLIGWSRPERIRRRLGLTPAFQALGTAVNVASAGTLQVDWPSHLTNDIALLITEGDSTTPTFSVAAGFVEVTNSPQVADVNSALRVWWCRATSGAMTSPVFNDVASDNHKVAQIVTFRGCITTGNPWDVTYGSTAASSTAVSIQGGTTTYPNCLVVAIVSNGTDTTTAQTSGWTNADLGSVAEVADVNTTAGGGGGFGVATGTKAAFGSFGATTATLVTASVQGLITIALRPPWPGPGSVILSRPAAGVIMC